MYNPYILAVSSEFVLSAGQSIEDALAISESPKKQREVKLGSALMMMISCVTEIIKNLRLYVDVGVNNVNVRVLMKQKLTYNRYKKAFGKYETTHHKSDEWTRFVQDLPDLGLRAFTLESVQEALKHFEENNTEEKCERITNVFRPDGKNTRVLQIAPGNENGGFGDSSCPVVGGSGEAADAVYIDERDCSYFDGPGAERVYDHIDDTFHKNPFFMDV